jgi:hypothetical protein
MTGITGGSVTEFVVKAASSLHMRRVQVYETICTLLNPLDFNKVLAEYFLGSFGGYSTSTRKSRECQVIPDRPGDL